MQSTGVWSLKLVGTSILDELKNDSSLEMQTGSANNILGTLLEVVFPFFLPLYALLQEIIPPSHMCCLYREEISKCENSLECTYIFGCLTLHLQPVLAVGL